MQVAHPSFRVHALRLSDFDYAFPKSLVAQYPAEPRDAARMMVLDRERGTIEHREVRDLPEYFGEGDVLVANDTMVFPARLRGIKENTGANVEVFLLRELNKEHRLWDSIVDPARKVRVGNKLVFEGGLAAEVIDNTTSRGRTIRFIFDGTPDELYQRIDAIGETPIPPYLRRKAEPADRVRYQSLFARQRGAVAAPKAGLHFTPDLLGDITARGTEVATCTLHLGLGSFQAVEVEDLSKHRMDSEFYQVRDDAVECVNRALTHPDRHVTAVGTSVVRALESCISASKTLKHGQGWTDKFIYPIHDFHICERLLTSFHRPKSTLLMTVAAFAGYDLLMEAYAEAVREEYRLFSFGDAMLIL
ncbi:tRNA preQ1(34) S-adenosylmethionine ribosyltransferase-isomerase QueA [Rubrivirga sp. IMCC43871]|uniref:tRNA preQ1(34) S-adenosylmethionine ribosyltransferase-isomerase QueA n=1 Tax=Rubrivirga sp. IMCC43871 TaxID=3391575 RepID=UPI00398FDB11